VIINSNIYKLNLNTSLLIVLGSSTKNGFHVHRKKGQGKREGNAIAGVGFGQCWEDDHNKKVQWREYQRNQPYTWVQYQDPVVLKLQAERMGHRRSEDHPLILA
jgi:hypothetical protein